MAQKLISKVVYFLPSEDNAFPVDKTNWKSKQQQQLTICFRALSSSRLPEASPTSTISHTVTPWTDSSSKEGTNPLVSFRDSTEVQRKYTITLMLITSATS